MPDILAPDEALSALSARNVIDRQAEIRGGAPFCLFPETGLQMTYGDLKRRAAGYAAFLASSGVQPGQSVAYMGGNGYASLMALLGCLYGGYRWTPVNLVSGPEAMAYVLEHSEARLLLLDPEQAELWQSVQQAGAPDLTVIDSPGDSGPEMAEIAESEADAIPRPGPDADGLLMYTSGTTGRPKGVRLSQGNLLAGGDNTRVAHRLGAADRALCVLPLYHINAYCVTVMAPLLSGGSIVLPRKFSTRQFWSWVDEHACSWASIVPTLISYLLQDEAGPSRPDGRLRFVRSASAPLAPEMHHQFEERFQVPMIETMGLTEASAQILSNPLPPLPRKIGSPGIAFGNDVRIHDENGVACAPGTEGEIQIRGANIMREYLKNPEATGDAFTDDGWFRSGDLGRFDEDGFVFVTGRLKELIIKGGENIAPREIDDVLYAHPGVIEAAAFAAPDDNYGQTVEACVVVNDGGYTEQELLELCRDKLGPFKAPDKVHFRDSLPKGPSGKIQRMKLSDLIYP